MHPERRKLTKEVAQLIEAEEKEAEEGNWEVGTRAATLPQEGQGRNLSPFHSLLLSPASPHMSPSFSLGTKHQQGRRHTIPESGI